MTDFWPSLEEQLADLNHTAAAVLERTHAAPDGLPPTGFWIRAMRVDRDARAIPATPWHVVAGWDGPIGTLSTRCRRRPGQAIHTALCDYLGEVPWSRRRPWERHILVVEPQQPADDVCRQCTIGLERDAAAVIAEQRAAEQATLVGLLPAIESIATDESLDDAERGRRLRALWPRGRHDR